MPELPDIALYLHALAPRVTGEPLQRIRLASLFVLRSTSPAVPEIEGRIVRELRRLGKRIVFAFDDEYALVLHLMIAGRLRWRPPATKVPGKVGLAAFDFPKGTLLFTEASAKHRASLYLVHGAAALAEHDPGGLDVRAATTAQFGAVLRSESHTVKRALTDPGLFDGIGNAYSDEILHAAKLSPLKLTTQLDDAEIARLHRAARDTLVTWIERLQVEAGSEFPEKVTAFREGMAVHGRYRQPCPVCAAPVQRIRYASNEANYCARCQTGGRLLADRALSRLLKQDWPRSLDDWEARTRDPGHTVPGRGVKPDPS
jgi:formamidopyrimidine-DNA glycosylase